MFGQLLRTSAALSLLLPFGTLITSAHDAHAAPDVPETMTLQGHLLTATGEAISGSVALDVAIYDAAVDGELLYSEQLTSVALDSGSRFSVDVGIAGTFGASLASLSEAFILYDELWVSLAVDGGDALPRQRFLSSAFAFRAQHAVNSDGVSCDACITGTELAAAAVTSAKLAPASVLASHIAEPCSAGHVLKVANGAWSCQPDAGGIGSITAGAGLTGGTVTNIGTLALDTPTATVLGGVLGLSCGANQYVSGIEVGTGAPTCADLVVGDFIVNGAGQIDAANDFGFAASTHIPNLDADSVDGRSGAQLDTDFVNAGEANSITNGMVAAGTLNPNRVAGTAATLTGSQTFDGGTLRINAGNNRVGVGTTSPAATLHVAGDLQVDGAIIAAADPDFGYDTGWFSAPVNNSLTVQLGTTPNQFIYTWARLNKADIGQIRSPMMGASHSSYTGGPTQRPNGTSARLWSLVNRKATNDIGDSANTVWYRGELRMVAVTRVADFDSGWFACAANNVYPQFHNLGKQPEFVVTEVAENNNGSGWYTTNMSGGNHNGSNWVQANIIQLTATQLNFRTSTFLANIRRSTNGGVINATAGFCRVRAYDWPADYDSGYVPISTAVGNRDKWFQHNLGTMPKMVNLYVASDVTGVGGWATTALGQHNVSYTNGSNVYNVTENYAVVKGGAASVAHYINAAGAGTAQASGFVRFLAWK